MINFANLNVLTDYFVQETLRTPSGHVRHIILTEQGFTAYSPTRGDVPELQAAAFAYSYYLVDSNPYIDAYTLSRQVDAPSYEALKLFLLGAISRAFQPGCKFEIMLCLVGGQGAGKSTFFRLLAVRDEWFSDEIGRASCRERV